MASFSYVTPCSFVILFLCFGGNAVIRLQDGRIRSVERVLLT